MRTEKIIGLLLIVGTILLFIPFTVLTFIFDYPTILREEPGIILTRFYNGGTTLILVWWLFALVGLPILEAYVLIGQKLEGKLYFVRWATTLAVFAGFTQVIGLLRWSFVVPVIAKSFVLAHDEATRQACRITFQAIHQYGGVVLGEHLGQLFTITWTLMISSAFYKLKIMPLWVIVFGFVTAFIYLLAQGELFATVILGFPVWSKAGMIGGTMWMIWLLIIGYRFLKLEID